MGRDAQSDRRATAGADLTEANVIGFARESLAHFKYPTVVKFVDALPETSTGNIRKVELREAHGDPVAERVPFRPASWLSLARERAAAGQVAVWSFSFCRPLVFERPGSEDEADPELVEMPRAGVDAPRLVVVVVGPDETDLVLFVQVVRDHREVGRVLLVIVCLADERHWTLGERFRGVVPDSLLIRLDWPESGDSRERAPWLNTLIVPLPWPFVVNWLSDSPGPPDFWPRLWKPTSPLQAGVTNRSFGVSSNLLAVFNAANFTT